MALDKVAKMANVTGVTSLYPSPDVYLHIYRNRVYFIGTAVT